MDIAGEAALGRAQLDADYTAKNCTTPDDFARIIAGYHESSKAALSLPGTTLNLPYDTASGQVMDIFNAGENRAVLYFIHGGYWRALSKEHAAFMAPMLAHHGIATVAPDYTLAPQASLTEITRQIRAGFAHLWHNAAALGIDRDRIIVAGSSAGGHLAAMLAMPGWQKDFGLPYDAVRAALPISGLFELAPIVATRVQDWMQLTEAEVRTLSPLRHISGTAPSVIAVAEHETRGFHRQSTAYAEALGARHLLVSGRNHFDVILDLVDDKTALSAALLLLFKDERDPASPRPTS